MDATQLETVISAKDNYSGHSRELNKTQNKVTHTRTDRALVAAYRDINSLGEAMGLPRNIVDTAKQIYRKVEEMKGLRGKAVSAVTATCIFIACRQGNVGRTFKEICNISRVQKNELGRVFKSIEKMLTEESRIAAEKAAELTPINTPQSSAPAVAIINDNTAYNPAGATSAADLMTRFCNHLNLPTYVQTTCVEFALRVNEVGSVAGRSPISIAGAGIYFVSALLGHPKSARDIGEVAGVSEGTIKNAYKYIWRDREKLVLPSWIEGGRGKMSSLPTP